MTEREMQAHAQRIISEHVKEIDYVSDVYYDPDLVDATEDECVHIHDLIVTSSVTAQFR